MKIEILGENLLNVSISQPQSFSVVVAESLGRNLFNVFISQPRSFSVNVTESKNNIEVDVGIASLIDGGNL